jgi:Tfp pilus assembly protein PilF
MMKRMVLPLMLGLVLSALALGCSQDRAASKAQAEAKMNLGMTLLNKGDRQGALKNLLEAEKSDPENEKLQNAIGLAYAHLGRMENAVSHFKKALQIKPDYSDAMNNLGIIYAGEAKHALAIEMFKKSAEDVLYPSRHTAYNNLGSIYLSQRQYERALESYRKAVHIFPEYSGAHDNMGLAYEGLRQWDHAIDSYKLAIQHAPDYTLYYLHLANVNLRFNRRDEARELVRKAMSLDKAGQFKAEARRLLEESERRR